MKMNISADSKASVLSTNENGDDSSLSETELESKIANGISCTTVPETATIPWSLFSEPRATTNIGHIALQDCTQVTFGNQNFFQGAVTVVCDNHNLNAATDEKPTGNNRKLGCFDRISRSRRRKLILIASVSIILLGITACLLLIGLLTSNDDNTSSSTFVPDWNSNTTTDGNDTLRIITRGEWLARSPLIPPSMLELPSTKVIIAHTVTPNCSNEESCTAAVQNCQNFHMDTMNFGDIGYNFLVGGDGNVYEGVGWNREGAHTYHYNKRSICIAFIGNFSKIKPPERQLIAAQKLIERGLEMKKLTADYRLFGHRQLIDFESPGRELYKIIVKWPHWSENVFAQR